MPSARSHVLHIDLGKSAPHHSPLTFVRSECAAAAAADQGSGFSRSYSSSWWFSSQQRHQQRSEICRISQPAFPIWTAANSSRKQHDGHLNSRCWQRRPAVLGPLLIRSLELQEQQPGNSTILDVQQHQWFTPLERGMGFRSQTFASSQVQCRSMGMMNASQPAATASPILCTASDGLSPALN